MGLKAPKGYGWLTNPKKAAYNRIYHRTTRSGCMVVIVALVFLVGAVGGTITWTAWKLFQ